MKLGRAIAKGAAIGALLTVASGAAIAAEPVTNADVRSSTALKAPPAIPALLDADQKAGYERVFAAIRDSRWTDAQLELDSLKPGPLHAIARAELYTAKGSPKVDVERLVALLNEAPELPQAEQLARLARSRGAHDLPPLPETHTLIWQDGAPRRTRAKSVRSDQIAADLAAKMQPFVKADDGPSARALLESTQGLSPEALTEWQQKVAWIYFLSGDDANARALAAQAAEGYGDWAVQGRWTVALSAWRQNDCQAAATAFEGTAARATDVDLRAAALYWAARADMVCGRPDKIEGRLRSASQFRESFYGQLARQALGMHGDREPRGQLVATDWAALDRRPNILVAAALVEIGETDLADQVIRQQARIGQPTEFRSLVRLAESLDLPATTVWLAHNCPAGVTATAEARYPTPSWKPDSGWRVEKALVYAHTLQESGFRNKVVSPAGAYGLMQIMPAAATDFARERGVSIDRSALTKPSTNMDIGQRHLERLRDMTGITGGLLPKVIAAYNAGPKPVGEWNSLVRDGGDPLLYIESIPYWETRGYVTMVLRNYWMYESQTGKSKSPSRAALAQGMWPRFPGLPGASAIRLQRPNVAQARVTPKTTIALNATVSPQSHTAMPQAN
ncbi:MULTISPECIES: lytic transglycosylase domain-containing protein [Sphingomonas]|jgi:soluble lytic murein transglycosylase|uniref:Lytic transglycosylase domain-containing protein n=1 Tax=Sphingomonas zeae TaxID=1646122 RepID=A0A7Y6B578_9SPHN|nr:MULTISPECIES: lytic transglycosylase domain-containing protein [Sphingomonas]MBB4048242.1 soluble lytic murein transglycosylase-like protein [Sphingomonas zeae]MDK8186131.1 lytic transglycosylase domain-containing protein [Sphingomonas zeae]MDK8215654.1 lytic transglycosylase domain-containing protein [Sphingomonas sp. UMB7805-LC452B]NUU46652.1 lytic transglycosylase domain-containing protein [Sphingomonas zeae]